MIRRSGPREKVLNDLATEVLIERNALLLLVDMLSRTTDEFNSDSEHRVRVLWGLEGILRSRANTMGEAYTRYIDAGIPKPGDHPVQNAA
ncbi:MAG: hypothetical protein ACRD18_12500 [Terriglobia bacterium]